MVHLPILLMVNSSVIFSPKHPIKDNDQHSIVSLHFTHPDTIKINKNATQETDLKAHISIDLFIQAHQLKKPALEIES